MTSTMDYGAVVDRGPWPEAIAREFERARDNGCVGTRLISETERVRVWEIRLKPGERISFHRHVLDYFWTAVTAGRGRSRMQDGTTVEKSYLDAARELRTGRVQDSRLREHRRRRARLHHGRVPRQRQRRAAGAGRGPGEGGVMHINPPPSRRDGGGGPPEAVEGVSPRTALGIAPSTMLRMVPPPLRGRGSLDAARAAIASLKR